MFDGHVALVTGGTRGIGAAITTMLAQNGARVAAGYSKGRETAEALQQRIDPSGERVSIHQGRVDKPEDCQRVVDEVQAKFGRIDFLVNNAGITVDKTVRKMTFEDWHNVLDVNLFGAFAMTKAVLEHMIERGSGRIVNISSVIGETGNVGQANYAASKAGLFGLTKSLALEMAQPRHHRQLRRARLHRNRDGGPDPQGRARRRSIDKIPQRRLGRPDEVARVVQFLLEDESSYITGAVYNVNGGLDM